MTELSAWAILLIPIAAFLLIGAGRLVPALRRQQLWAGYLAIIAILLSFALSCWALATVFANGGASVGFVDHNWLNFGFLNQGSDAHVTIPFGIHLDSLTAMMLVIATSISFLVQVYSQGYMHGDNGYSRYYAYMCLFTASMIGLVLASSLLMVFFFWELVGLCSYLLIGFWFHRPSAAAAAKKAFIVTRFGDLGFLAAIVLIWTRTGTFVIADIQRIAMSGQLGGITLTLFALGVFAGAAGKSAQFPLHIWLPDAMEGPTPVSALIHAATMVAAGVYLVGRLYPVFASSSEAMHTVAVVGGVTALVGGLLGLVMTDIKRVLAYSTISQLGYMMLGLGVGSYVGALFHLLNHAFFKSMLFLDAGSVHHASNTFDMRRLGGLRRYMPITFWTFVIGALSLSGIPPLSGFWSKDEIVHAAWDDNGWLFALAFIAVFLTAFYMFRALYVTFFGSYRGGAAPEMPDGGGPVYASQQHADESETAAFPETGPSFTTEVPESRWRSHRPRESPWVMVLPLVLLAIPSVLSGFLNANGAFGDYIKASLPASMQGINQEVTNWWLLLASSFMALAGIVAATVVYFWKRGLDVTLGQVFRPIWAWLSQRMYIDALVENVIVRDVFYRGICVAAQAIDTYLIDGAVNGAGWVTREAGVYLRRAQNGELQTYGFVFLTGVVLIAALVFVLHP